MRLCVCGLGRVGKPILDMLRSKNIPAVGYDIDTVLTECSLSNAVRDSDAAIFIVQTPSLKDGSFANKFLLQALRNFKREVNEQGKSDYLYIIGSTVVPGSCDEFRQIVGDNVCYKPEFIRLEYVREDLLSPDFILIGSHSVTAGDRCESIYHQMFDVPVKRMSLMEAELTKITLNCALAMKISLANQLHLVASKVGANSMVIMEAVGSDHRIGNLYLVPGKAYGGPCLPRDNKMFQYFSNKCGVTAWLSRAADQINREMK